MYMHGVHDPGNCITNLLMTSQVWANHFYPPSYLAVASTLP